MEGRFRRGSCACRSSVRRTLSTPDRRRCRRGAVRAASGPGGYARPGDPRPGRRLPGGAGRLPHRGRGDRRRAEPAGRRRPPRLVRRLVELLDQGATPEAALADAGAQLARDRDTDPKRAQWALSVLGFAIRRLDATIPTVTVEAAPPPARPRCRRRTRRRHPPVEPELRRPRRPQGRRRDASRGTGAPPGGPGPGACSGSVRRSPPCWSSVPSWPRWSCPATTMADNDGDDPGRGAVGHAAADEPTGEQRLPTPDRPRHRSTPRPTRRPLPPRSVRPVGRRRGDGARSAGQPRRRRMDATRSRRWRPETYRSSASTSRSSPTRGRRARTGCRT